MKKLTALAQTRDLQRQRSVRLRKARQQRWRHRLRRLLRAAVAAITILVAALFIGLARGGLGADGFLLTLLLMAVAFTLLAVFPRTLRARAGGEAPPDLATLADNTQQWLEAQRNLVPSGSRPLVDRLGNQLDELASRLVHLDPQEPVARELRQMLTEHLPTLVNSYTRIPEALTNLPHAGATPAAELHAGLETAAREVDNIGKIIAGGELDALAIRRRYLDTRYDPDRTGAEA